jgi:hypothetical protein
MNSELRAFVKEARYNLRKTAKSIYDNHYGLMTDEEFLADLNAKKALLEKEKGRRFGEPRKMVVLDSDGEITPLGQILIQNQANN